MASQLLAMVGAATVLAGATSARADYVPPCPPRAGIQDVALADTPRVVVARFESYIDAYGYAMPGEPFDATDVTRIGIHFRLIYIRHKGNRWVVAYEHGGLEYNVLVLALDLSPDGMIILNPTEDYASPRSVCAITERLLGLPK